MSETKVKDGNLEDALKRFKRQCARNGVLQEVKHYHMHVLPNYAENNNKTLDEIFNLLTK